ncbi:MAG: hypothetical protein A2445_00095 [Candidatus Jacksonbacteria bacterium RIFOXYC2_FULL_44_29]|nr:MAG: Hydrogenase assembly chaperone HypC/HupF [Parcubacteria group bacterium GW2011_GWC2_44_22]OGY75714.1 MAG: hypothetical protein A2240_06205 [Candidatus Jacksonbacteria bacterium RIFOXYA2_FULL_43_12]OGY78107.1 MAG: hypothetical protein A2445_00095 [Candidatus Jacksonbacteria bacterium RIFOXYC2_FULL_44_29]OGY81074.1 MAG: hypothetical protein A2550_02575 [Candidatus Jacksonbacteria bacterium RIFOXYD2_FULL_43_21]HBH46242.1 HypC/HybG/HupF family hydrogenase formation chaperone [Candidatus Jac
MCLAIPGKIINIIGGKATVEYSGESRTAKIVTGHYKIGDYVIVQAGLVIEKVPQKQVRLWKNFLKSTAL